MLSTPHTRFSWAKSDRTSDFSFFRTLIKRRRRPTPAPRRIVAKKSAAPAKWKPAVWTPWLWVK
jgi:hypothetical protein